MTIDQIIEAIGVKPFHQEPAGVIYCADALELLRHIPDESVQCCVTSPPYWGLRDYGIAGQLGLEKTPEEYVEKMVQVFHEVRRVLRKDGTLWLNLGDSYMGSWGNNGSREGGQRQVNSVRYERHAWDDNIQRPPMSHKMPGLKEKNLAGIPWRVAFGLQADGWYLRQDIIWHNPNPMPESVRDRCTKAHEYIFLMSKNARYYFDNEDIKEDSIDKESINGLRKRGLRQCDKTGDPKLMQNFYKLTGKVYKKRNRRSVWTITTKPYKGPHFATFPPDLVAPCILAGCPSGEIVLDPFAGSGTTGAVARNLGRKFIHIELSEKYCKLQLERLRQEVLGI